MVSGTFALEIGGRYSGDGPTIRTSDWAEGTMIWVDADGNGSTDMRVGLVGVTNLTASDFLL